LETSPTQLAAPQLTAVDGYAHLSGSPPQLPLQGPVPRQAGRVPTGSPSTVLQIPADPATLQAWHWALQLVLQHTPSWHVPLSHSALSLHAAPFGRFALHTPSSQRLGG